MIRRLAEHDERPVPGHKEYAMKWKGLALLTLLFLTARLASADDLPPVSVQQILALVAEKSTRTPAQQKMDSQLLQAVRESRGLPMAAGVNLAPVPVATDVGGKVLLDVDVTAADRLDAVLAKLEEMGAEVVHPSWTYRTLRVRLPLSAAEAAAGLPDVTFVKFAVGSIRSGAGVRPRPAIAAAQRALAVRSVLKRLLASGRLALTGTVTSQGDRTHRADDARNTFGYAGQGVRIGVLSDSFDALGGAAADVASGNLPGPGNPLGNTTPVTVLQDITPGTDEGRAMLQIVHDVAPKAQLFFATADASEASFAANITALRGAPYNCDIIIDDVFYFDEPVFQDGIVAQAVNGVTASGGLYFSSAGNEGNVAKNSAGNFEGDFNDAGSPAFTFPGGAKVGTIHNFGTVATPVNGDIITVRGGRYTLNWSDPVGASTNDYDLFLLSSAGVVKASSTNIQNGTQLAFEQIVPPALAAGDRLVVFKTAAAAVRAFSLKTIRGVLTVATTGETFGHSAAVDAFSVAAVPAAAAFGPGSPAGPFPGPYGSSNQVENFTSDGPRRVFFNADGTPITPGNLLFGTNGGSVRNKPDLTAADGVSTTLAAGSGLNPFFGTSAAAPHAGAIAALLKSANPALTAAQIRTILTTTAVDVETAGYDNISGVGIVQAFQAMQAVSPTPQATILLGTVTATEGAFSNGNGRIDPGETASLVLQLQNPSLAGATTVSATLTSSTPGLTITPATVSYGAIAASSSATNAGTPFTLGLASSIPCGTILSFTVTVSFAGGLSPQIYFFTLPTGFVPGASINATLGTPATGTGFTSVTGAQTNRVTRNGVASTCGTAKAYPGTTTTAGTRTFDAYTLTNTNAADQCVNVTLTATNGVNLFTVAYNNSGFVPATISTNYLADAGLSGSPQTYGFTVPAGQNTTVVVQDVPGTATGSAYTLSVSLAECAAGPACTPVTVSTPSIANGTNGVPYSQSFAATGGSGSYTFTLTGTLPTGLSFSGNTIAGTPTQTGSFPITVTPTDVAGCPSSPKGFTLVVGSAAADLAVAKTHVGSFTQGQQGVYTITVSNVGTAPTDGTPVTVADALPSGLTFVSSSAAPPWACGFAAGTLTCSRSDVLSPGNSYPPITLTVSATPTAPALVTNTAIVSGGGNTNPANDASSDPTTVNPGSGFLNLMTACRALDTRAGAPIAAFATLPVVLSGGACGIPPTAKAVVYNVVATQETADGLLILYAGNQAAPATSNLNFTAGKTRAGNGIVQLATDGSGTINVLNASPGTVHVVIDVSGWFN